MPDMVAIKPQFRREKVSEMRASAAEACSSWSNLKRALQVKNTLEGHQSRYVDANPLWINEGKLALYIGAG